MKSTQNSKSDEITIRVLNTPEAINTMVGVYISRSLAEVMADKIYRATVARDPFSRRIIGAVLVMTDDIGSWFIPREAYKRVYEKVKRNK